MFNDIKYEFIKIDKKNTSFHLKYSHNGIENRDIEIKLDVLSEDVSLNDQIVGIINESILHDKRNAAILFFKNNEGGKIPFYFFKEGDALNHDLGEREADIHFRILESDDISVKIRPYSLLFKKEESEYPYNTYNIDEFIMGEFNIKDALLKRCESDIVNILSSEKKLNSENINSEKTNNLSIETGSINFIN